MYMGLMRLVKGTCSECVLLCAGLLPSQWGAGDAMQSLYLLNLGNNQLTGINLDCHYICCGWHTAGCTAMQRAALNFLIGISLCTSIQGSDVLHSSNGCS